MKPSTRRQFIATGATSVGILLAGCSGDDGGDGGDGASGVSHTVQMTDELEFDPWRLPIDPGDTVVWENVSSVGHTVTGDSDSAGGRMAYFASGGFDTEEAARSAFEDDRAGVIPAGETYEHTFQQEASYEYYCIPHEEEGMEGRIVVRE